VAGVPLANNKQTIAAVWFGVESKPAYPVPSWFETALKKRLLAIRV
jgi:hypothetical protein